MPSCNHVIWFVNENSPIKLSTELLLPKAQLCDCPGSSTRLEDAPTALINDHEKVPVNPERPMRRCPPQPFSDPLAPWVVLPQNPTSFTAKVLLLRKKHFLKDCNCPGFCISTARMTGTMLPMVALRVARVGYS